jgi:hypothetical protein
VIASQKADLTGISDLECKKEAKSLNRLLSTVNVISKEQKFAVGRRACVVEESQKVVILAMNISSN